MFGDAEGDLRLAVDQVTDQLGKRVITHGIPDEREVAFVNEAFNGLDGLIHK